MHGHERTLGQALSHVRKFGRVLSMGFCTAPDLVAAEHMDAGKADPRAMVTATIPLDDLPGRFEAMWARMPIPRRSSVRRQRNEPPAIDIGRTTAVTVGRADKS